MQDACCYDDDCGIFSISAWRDTLKKCLTGDMVAGNRSLTLNMIVKSGDVV